MAVVNSATVIFGAKLAVTDEILNVYELADSQNPMLLTPHRIQNTSNEACKQAKSKKKAKSTDLVVLSQSQREKIFRVHHLQGKSLFSFKGSFFSLNAKLKLTS